MEGPRPTTMFHFRRWPAQAPAQMPRCCLSLLQVLGLV